MSARRTTLLVLSLAPVAAALSLGASRASAAIPSGSPSASVDFCATAPAVPKIDLVEFLSEEVYSTDATYASSSCGHFLVDVHVPATDQRGSVWVGGGAAPVLPGYPYEGNSADTCNALTENITIYEKAGLATSFTRVAYGTLKGTWNSPFGVCGLTSVYGDLPGTWGGTSTGHAFATSTGIHGDATYRVAVWAKLSTSSGTTWLPVSVDAGW